MLENTSSFKCQEEANVIHSLITIQRFSLQEEPHSLTTWTLAACFVFSVTVSHPHEGTGPDHLL